MTKLGSPLSETPDSCLLRMFFQAGEVRGRVIPLLLAKLTGNGVMSPARRVLAGSEAQCKLCVKLM